MDRHKNVVFDLGNVLIEWDRRLLFEKLIDDPAELQWFLQLLSRRAPRVWGTITLLALNVAVYALMVLTGVPAFSPPPTDMLAWGAVRGPEVLAGEWCDSACSYVKPLAEVVPWQ